MVDPGGVGPARLAGQQISTTAGARAPSPCRRPRRVHAPASPWSPAPGYRLVYGDRIGLDKRVYTCLSQAACRASHRPRRHTIVLRWQFSLGVRLSLLLGELEGAVASVLKEGLGDTKVDRSEVEALRRQFADLEKRVAG